MVTKEKFTFNKNQDLYTIKLKKKNRMWLLLLFLLLLFIPIPYTLKINTIDQVDKHNIENTKVFLTYEKSIEKQTNQEGISKFTVKWDLLIIYLFRNNKIDFDIDIDAEYECYDLYSGTNKFQVIKKSGVYVVALSPKSIPVLIVNKKTNEIIDSAKVDIIKYWNSDKSNEIKFSDKEGFVYQTIFGTDKLFFRASKKGYLSDSIEIDEINNLCNSTDTIILKLEKAFDPTPQPPCEGCGVFFTGRLVGEKVENSKGLSIPFFVDEWSEYVGSGEYSDNKKAFPKAVGSSFDGIAIDKGTRLIVYSKPNFQGDVLLDTKGPIIINNIKYKSSYLYVETITFSDEIQNQFPPAKRIWSETDMQPWSKGSVKIICD